LRAVVDRRSKRRIAALGLAGALAAGSVLGMAAPSGATDPAEASTVSGYGSGTWNTNDAKHTVVTIAAGATAWGPTASGRANEWQSSTVLDATVTQSFCQKIGGKDNLIERTLSSSGPINSGADIQSKNGKMTLSDVQFTLTGTEKRTPGTSANLRCTGLNSAQATTTPMSVPAKVKATASNAKGSSAIMWACDPVPAGCGGSFYYRVASVIGTLTAPALGMESADMGKSASGWFWAGLWKYPEGT
jgi:hypothetical protein